MKTLFFTSLTLAIAFTLVADDRGTLIFEDDFERNESQEMKDEVGKGWGTNSKSRAAGNKQVDLKDGAMFITMHAVADHAVSVTHPAEFRDGTVELRFRLDGEKDTLGLDFADPACQEVHAGHLFRVTVGIKQVSIDDSKTGGMNMKFYEAKKANTLTTEQKKFITSMKKNFPVKLETGKWYTLVVNVKGDTVVASIDGTETGTLSSEGFAHPPKHCCVSPYQRAP